MSGHRFGVEELLEVQRLLAAVDDATKPAAREAATLSLINVACGRHGSDAITTCDGFAPSSLDVSVRRRLAVVLLTLLDRSPKLWNEQPTLRYGTFALFDDVFQRDVYVTAGITAKDQGYEKERKLKDLASLARSTLSDSLVGLSTIASVRETQKEFMKALGDPGVKALILPLLPAELCAKAAVLELFNSVGSYHAAPLDRAVAEYESSKATLEQYLTAAVRARELSNARIFIDLAQTLLTILAENFQSHPANAPAHIQIGLGPKKYPLHRVGDDITIAIEIRNDGPGPALDVELCVDEADGLELLDTRAYLGTVAPGDQVAPIRATIASGAPAGTAELLVTCKWREFNNQSRDASALLALQSQRSDVGWAALEDQNFYDLEPISDRTRLVGRTSTLNRLFSSSTSKSIGNSYIFGQKRVGKTSIARALKDQIEGSGQPMHVIYLEGGDYVRVDPGETVAALGRRLCQEIQDSVEEVADLSIPEFTNALAPFSDFYRGVVKAVPDFRVLFILDEFDALPIGLYRRSELGDAFFLTLRTTSGKHGIGFILVGGEKMEMIVSAQGENLNKFQKFPVNYFDRRDQWDDFCELVRGPVQEWLEVTDEAVVEIYHLTAGNPFFTNLVCSEMAELMIGRRDCHVTSREVDEALEMTLTKAGVASFMHFWEDGIFESGSDEERVSLTRRQILLAFARSLIETGTATEESIIAHARVFGVDLTNARAALEEFTRRDVLRSENESFRCVVPLFERWLTGRGYSEIITNAADREGYEALRVAEEAALVKSDEIVKLTQPWPPFRGRPVGAETVRAWLTQFGKVHNQRLMFKLLENLRFFDSLQIRTWLRQAQVMIDRTIDDVQRERYGMGKERRSDILLVRVGTPDKSGALYTKIYANENAIRSENIVDAGQLQKALDRNGSPKALVVVDDFVGSGNTLASAVVELDSVASASGLPGVPIVVVALVAMESGLDHVRKALEGRDRRIEVRCSELLTPEDQPFSKSSRIFGPDERSEARALAAEKGALLVRKDPLGWSDSQALVVFEHSIPNNSLPILWADAASWMPLFPRF